MYLVGNPVHFNKSEWAWLHFYMVSQLATSGIIIRKIQVFNWAIFGFWILALYGSSFRLLVLFDYVVAIYFLLVVMASWSLPVENTWTPEEG